MSEDPARVAHVLRDFGTSLWTLAQTALEGHVREYHIARRLGPVSMLPMSGSELASAKDVLRHGGRMADVAAALGVSEPELQEAVERQSLGDFLRLCERALSEQPSSTAAD